MRRNSVDARALALAAWCALWSAGAHAQCTRGCASAATVGARPAASTPNSQLLNTVNTIAAPTTGVPVAETVNITTAGTYTVTLTDLGAALTPPAPLNSVKLAVTSGDAVVGGVLIGAGTLTLNSLAPGTYQLHIVGMPSNVPGSGPISIAVDGPGSTQIATFQDSLALPSQELPNGEGVLDTSFAVSSSGNYTVTLTDLQLPQSLSTLTLLLIQQGGSTPLATLPFPGTNALQTTVALTAGVTYELFAIGEAAATVNAGLFSAVVAPSGGGAIVIGRAVAVGNTIHVGSPGLAAGNDTLTLTDLSYPAALSQVGAALTLDGQVVATLSAPGSTPFPATPNTYDLYALGTAAAAAPGAGSYAVQITPGAGPALFGAARAVTAAGSADSGYSFDSSLTTAGAYTAGVADFQFPSPLASLGLVVVQNGALLGKSTTAGTVNFTGMAGPYSLLAFAQAAAAGGLFGVDVMPSAGGNPAFGVTQGVGTLFTAYQVPISTAGSYSVTATDLGFPAAFANFDTLVTSGAQKFGSIYGGGTFNFAATPGTYFVNIIAEPTGSDQAGTYALAVATAPPAPTVSLTTDESQVSSGSTVDIIWSSQNATACTASGGWSGTQPVSGTVTSVALTASTTFTLSCTGAGGSATQSTSVTVTASGSGGGGAASPELLTLLAALLLLRALRSRGGLNVRRAGLTLSRDGHASVLVCTPPVLTATGRL